MADSLGIEPSKSRAILIGTSEFERDHRLRSLRAVMANLRDLERLLMSKSIGFSDVIRIDNRPYPELIEKMRLACAEPADCLLVYYVGHGLVGEDKALLLATANTTFDGRDDNAVPYRSIRRLLSEATGSGRIRILILVLDCCFGGRAFDEGPILTRADVESFLAGPLGKIYGSYMIAACSATEQAYWPEGSAHTGFTGHLIAVLENGIADDRAVLTIDDVFARVRTECARTKLPDPVKVVAGDADRVGLCKNAGRIQAAEVGNNWIDELNKLKGDLGEELDTSIDDLIKKEKEHSQQRQTLAKLEATIADLIDKEGAMALEHPITKFLLGLPPYRRYIQSNPTDAKLLSEEIVITIEDNGDTHCIWERQVVPTQGTLRSSLPFMAFGDIDQPNFNAIGLTAKVNEPTKHRAVIAPLQNKPKLKEFVIFTSPGVPAGTQVRHAIEWKWPRLFEPLITQRRDVWAYNATTVTGLVPLAIIKFRVAKALGQVSIRNIGTGGGEIQALESTVQHHQYTWRLNDFDSSIRVILELSIQDRGPAILG